MYLNSVLFWLVLSLVPGPQFLGSTHAMQPQSDVRIAELPAPSIFLRGDCDGDGVVGLGDALKGLSYLFGTNQLDCLDAADFNDDGTVNLGDMILLLSFLFGDGAPPPPPFPVAGIDPTADPLTCQ